MKYITFFLTLISLPSLGHAEKKPTPERSVIYKTIADTKLKLFVFEPEGHQKSDQKPAIVFFFGGGWNGGTPKQFYSQAETLSQKGMVAFAAEYRVKSRNKTTPFEAVEDAKSAIRWVRQNAQELGIDPNKIVTSGGSAGGHIAACTGIIEGYEAKGEDLKISSKPNAMILYNPVLDTTKNGYGAKSVGKGKETHISPNHHIRGKIPPTLVLHGTADTTVPFENAERFAKLMKKSGNQCTLIPSQGKGHGFFNSPFFRTKIKDTSDYQKSETDTIEFLKSLNYINK